MSNADTQSGMRVIGTETGSWLWQRPCGRVVPFKFSSRETAFDCLPDTIHEEFDGSIELEFEAHEVCRG